MTRILLSSQVEIFFTESGDRDAPVLLWAHGWCCDSHDWSWQLPAFADGFRLIAPDLRGHGRSSTPDAGYETSDFAADLIELCDRLEARRIIGIGHSMGAMVLSDMAIARPDLVRGLVMVDPAYGGDVAAAERIRDGIPQLLGPGGMDILEQQVAALEGPQTAGHLRLWHARRLAGMSQPVAVRALAGMQITEAAWGPRPLAGPHLAGRRCPVLALYAGHRVRQAAWERTIGADITTYLIDAGHWLHQERPDEVNEAIRSWIDDRPE